MLGGLQEGVGLCNGGLARQVRSTVAAHWGEWLYIWAQAELLSSGRFLLSQESLVLLLSKPFKMVQSGPSYVIMNFPFFKSGNQGPCTCKGPSHQHQS